MPQGLVCHEAGGMSSRTAVDWFNFCRDVCAQCLDRHEVLIGGFNENGEPIVVEIDESMFFFTANTTGGSGGLDTGCLEE